ncbi:MAG: cupin domain-containing protein [Candidatus Bathyarchaeota archaeon]|nr:MAG: cupin domain-containing protein [Candidatus Bathyarchaeota archaeon]
MSSGLVRKSESCPPDELGPFPARILLSKVDTKAMSVKHGVLPVGQEIDIHYHEEQDQIEFYLSGKALLFVEGVRESQIGSGSFMYAPKGVKHGIRSVEEPLEIITVFVPSLF